MKVDIVTLRNGVRTTVAYDYRKRTDKERPLSLIHI